jgi:mannose-6-phosphate isomerase-like protein (cupin superfamily)
MRQTTIAPLLRGSTLGNLQSNFVLAEWRDDGGVEDGPPRLIAPLHLHRNDDEAWYVLEGALCIQRGDEVVELAAGSAVLVPRGTPHTYWNPTPRPTRYLLVMTPRIFQLIEAIHSLKERSPAAVRELFGKYDSELLGA